MRIGMIGLGKMGGNMVRRLIKAGHECVVYDVNRANIDKLASEGAIPAVSIEDLASQLKPPRVVWLMVPAGEPTEQAVLNAAMELQTDDIVIDGGNSYFKDDVRRASALNQKGIHFMDVGTSGGVWGETRGYCLMVGGEKMAFERVEPIFKALAPGAGSEIVPTPGAKSGSRNTASLGYLHCGPVGAGHFVKMIHNGIEYGMMQALAEGFDIMKNAGSERLAPETRYDLDLPQIAELWRRGSVVSSWLLDLIALSLVKSPQLSEFQGIVPDSGEGRWTVLAAIEQSVPANVLTASLYTRFRSRQENNFGEKLLSAMRQQFGGHKEPDRRGGA